MRISPFNPYLAVLLALGVGISGLWAQEQAKSADQPAAAKVEPLKSPFAKWEKEISGIEKRLAEGKFPVGGIAFVGSSTMRMWKLEQSFPDWKLANVGFGGANIPDQLEFFDRLLGNLKPKQVIFYCGGNDLSQKRTPEQVVADYETWVGRMKKLVPDCEITFLGIRPSSSRAKIRDLETQANLLVKACCEKHGLRYLGLEDTVTKADGSIDDSLFLPDKLHLNEAGYKIWSARLLPFLNAKLPH